MKNKHMPGDYLRELTKIDGRFRIERDGSVYWRGSRIGHWDDFNGIGNETIARVASLISRCDTLESQGDYVNAEFILGMDEAVEILFD